VCVCVCFLSVDQEECFETRPRHYDSSVGRPVLLMVHVTVCMQLMNDGEKWILETG